MKKNKYLNGILPMILINFSIGTVYCWTLFKEDIIAYTGFSKTVTEWCFSLAIFFLGMSAAFGGKIVEKDVKKSSLITCVMVTLGWIVTGIGIQYKSAVVTILGFGVIQGIGLGIGYITPVKTLMLWMNNSKGFAAGLTIAGFVIPGLIANPMIVYFLRILPVYSVFFLLAGIYAVCTFTAHRLIYRPEEAGTREAIAQPVQLREIVFTWKFILLWLLIFLNIMCGLALISQEKQIYRIINENISDELVVLCCIISVVFNFVGRLAMASLQDRLKRKHIPYFFMAVSSLVVCFVTATSASMMSLTLMMMWVVNFFFGCGFSCLPNILEQHYSMRQLSTVLGLTLSAWAVAGLVGNQLALFVITNFNLTTLYVCLGALFTVEFLIFVVWARATPPPPPTAYTPPSHSTNPQYDASHGR